MRKELENHASTRAYKAPSWLVQMGTTSLLKLLAVVQQPRVRRAVLERAAHAERKAVHLLLALGFPQGVDVEAWEGCGRGCGDPSRGAQIIGNDVISSADLVPWTAI